MIALAIALPPIIVAVVLAVLIRETL